MKVSCFSVVLIKALEITMLIENGYINYSSVEIFTNIYNIVISKIY